MNHAKLLVLLLSSSLVALAGCSSPAEPVRDDPEQQPLVVFLVRHAEKADLSEDPMLSSAGRARAAALARVLGDAGIEHVHSSDFIRTRDTAAPTAAALGLEVRLYDPHDLPALADTLRKTGGRHLVVGHSDTTPAAVELLGGDPGPPIDETDEFDRLHVVTVGRDGTAASALLRYGETFDSG